MKTWRFYKYRSMYDRNEYRLSEEQLDDAHIQLLIGEVLRYYSELPNKAKELFKKEIKS